MRTKVLVASFLLILSAGLIRHLTPNFHLNSKEQLPFVIKKSNVKIPVEITVKIRKNSPKLFHLHYDDCIQDIKINGVSFNGEKRRFCDYPNGRIFDFSKYLTKTNNTISFDLINLHGPGVFRIRHLTSGTVFIALQIVFLAAAISLLSLLLRNYSFSSSFIVIFSLGVILRWIYLLQTPFWLRAYDWEEHLLYIKYIAENLSVPEASGGWEFYQPPLYYFVSSLIYRFVIFIKANEVLAIKGLELFAFIVSSLTLFVGLNIGQLIFKEENQKKQLVFFMLILSCFPGFILFSTRISNDIFLMLFSFLSFYFVCKYWKNGKLNAWILLSISVSLGVLSKSNVFIFLPLLTILLLVKEKKLKPIIKKFSIFSLIFISLTAWYFNFRFEGKSLSLIGEKTALTLNQGLKLENSIKNFTVFSPQEIIKKPYNSSWKDSFRRQFFWEYLFKSSLFGEFQFGNKLKLIAQIMLVNLLLLLLFILYGLFYSVRDLKILPINCVFFLLLSSLLYARISYPFSPHQDFRHIILILIPLSYYLSFTCVSPNKGIRVISSSLLGLFCFFSAVFIFVVSLSVPFS